MRKVIYSMMVSLDGFISRPNGDLDWSIIDEELHKYVNDRQREVDTYLHGRRMYELLAEYWPTADADPSAPDYIVEFARIWKNMSKIVFSKTLKQAGWNATLARDIVPEEIAKLKAQPGKAMDVGGAQTAATFMQLGLIDEYDLYVNPVILGAGVPMFPALSNPINLDLVETRTFRSGVVLLRYRRPDEG